MARTIAGSKRKHPHYSKLTLFASPNNKGDGGKWFCRVIFDRKRVQERSLNLEYLPDDAGNVALAEQKAVSIYYELEKEWHLGLPVVKMSVAKTAGAYWEQAAIDTSYNNKLNAEGANPAIPRRLIPGGNSAWDDEKLRQARFVIEELIEPYASFGVGDITHTTIPEIAAWSEWRASKRQKQLQRKWTAGTLNKQNRVLRSIFKWAKAKGMVQTIPDIKDVPESLRASRRPEITKHQYETLLKFVEQGYLPGHLPQLARYYKRMFYLWLCTIDATGVRPWKDDKNALLMKDVDIEMNGADVKHILLTRREKGKHYKAVADKHWLNIWQDILDIREAWGITSEYVFAHPEDQKGGRIKKNSPILNFRTQWRNAVEFLGYAKKGDPQQKRISPYSLRHRYAARRYLVNKDVTLEELAQVMGSSPRVLYEVYWHYKAEDNYLDLVAGGYELKPNRVRLMDDYGIRVGNTERNSQEHIEHFNKHPRFTDPPEGMEEPPWK